MRERVGTLVAIEVASAIGIIIFWIAFFAVGLAPAEPPPGYFVFEHAFPGPDMVLAMTMLVAASRLRSPLPERHRSGRTLSIAAAGALIFLGLLDISFNLQNGMYGLSFADGATAALVNTWCLGAGVVIMRLCHRM